MAKIAVTLEKPRCGFALKFVSENGEETKKIKKAEVINGVNVGELCKQLLDKNHTTWTVESDDVANIAIDQMINEEFNKLA